MRIRCAVQGHDFRVSRMKETVLIYCARGCPAVCSEWTYDELRDKFCGETRKRKSVSKK